MVKLLLILCLIATAGFGADENFSAEKDVDFFSVLLDIFVETMTDGLSSFSQTIAKYYINGIISAFLTIIILIYATRKIREGTFEFPKDAIEIILFFTMVWFVNQCLSDSDFLFSITSVLDIPANSILEALSKSEITKKMNSTNHIGSILTLQINTVLNNMDLFCGTGLSLNPFKLKVMSLIKLFIWCAYAIFAFILIASITMTYILTMIQIIFWKAFATLIIPLIYFKVTRGMTIHWLKTIIALSLISIFMIIIAIMSSNTELILIDSLNKSSDPQKGATFTLMVAIIIAKIIAITLLKEIPTMINGMLGTQAAGGAGAFANSVTMGAIGAAAAGAGFAAFKGAMRGGKVASGGAKTIGTWAKNQGGAANQLNKDVGGGSAGGSGSASSGGSSGATNIGGNVSKKTANVSTGSSNSSSDNNPNSNSNNWKQGLSNIWNGKAYQHKEPPKE